MSDERSLSVSHASHRALSAFADIGSFENAQRMAKALAVSTFVPKDYQGKVENVLVALEVAHRTGSSVLAVMQSLHVIHGKPGWSAQYIIASINGSGRFGRLRFRMSEPVEREIEYEYWTGDRPNRTKRTEKIKVRDRQCVAYASDIETGEIVEGPPCSIEMAVREGWFTKSDSKWKSMPELMLQYRAATFFGRLHVPDLLLGMQTDDELRDVSPQAEATSSGASAPDTVQVINERVKAKTAGKKAAASGPVIEGQVVESKPVPVVEQETSPDGGFV